MNRKNFVVVFLFVCFLSGLFYVGEFVTGQLHFITKCDPPNELDCPNRDFKGADLSGADLHGANFKGADLSGADLSKTLLYDANLMGAKLIGTNLYGANLRFADFKNADLSGANLRDASMISSIMFGANLSDANLSNADLSGANLTLTNLSNAEMANSILLNAVINKTTMPNGAEKSGQSDVKKPVNNTPNSITSTTNKPNQGIVPTNPSGQIRAVSIRCQDGNTFSSGCAVTWSNGTRSYPRSGSRSGSIVSGTDFYDMMGNHVCVDLYENGAARSYNC